MPDAFDRAVSAAENRNVLYGRVQLTASDVMFEKGFGKLSFIEGQHDPNRRRTEVGFVLSPIDEMGIMNLIQRSCIAESDEWGKLIWLSMKECGIKHPREMDGKFVKVQMVPNGRNWTDKKTGELRTGTTMKFLAVYKDESNCKLAFSADGNEPRESISTDDTQNTAADAMAVDMTPVKDNPERQTALAFIDPLVKQAKGDKAELAKLISNTPFISKWFTVESPEVQQLLGVA